MVQISNLFSSKALKKDNGTIDMVISYNQSMQNEVVKIHPLGGWICPNITIEHWGPWKEIGASMSTQFAFKVKIHNYFINSNRCPDFYPSQTLNTHYQKVLRSNLLFEVWRCSFLHSSVSATKRCQHMKQEGGVKGRSLQKMISVWLSSSETKGFVPWIQGKWVELPHVWNFPSPPYCSK